VRHARLVIHRLHLDGVEVPLRFGTLVAVDRSDDGTGIGSDDLDWEVVAEAVDEYSGELRRHHVELLCITGANAEGHLVLGEFVGDAFVVRFVDRAVVLRGDGPLTGLTPAMFAS
jgi:hypothetical protein